MEISTTTSLSSSFGSFSEQLAYVTGAMEDRQEHARNRKEEDEERIHQTKAVEHHSSDRNTTDSCHLVDVQAMPDSGPPGALAVAALAHS